MSAQPAYCRKGFMKGLLVISLVALVAGVAACAAGTAGEEKASSAEGGSVSIPDEMVAMAVWTVPAGDFRVGEPGYIQVRLTPLIAMDEAKLRAVSVDSNLPVVSPREYGFNNLDPEQFKPVKQKNSPPDPPALGMTIVRTFKVVAEQAGSYPIKVEFVYRGKIQSRDIVIKAH